MCHSCEDGLAHVKDFKRGGVEPSDFDDNVKIKSKKKAKKRKRAGCPANDGKAHIYVWATGGASNYGDVFKKRYGFYPYEYKVCCGCGKRASGGSRITKEYYEARKTRSYSDLWRDFYG